MSDPTTLADWAGVYATTTPYWGGYFSPVIVNPDGTADIAGTLITPEFSPPGTMSFEWTNVVNNGSATTAKGQLTFASDGTASGTINPQPQDGPLPWSATLATQLDAASLGNAIPAVGVLDVGDTFNLAAVDGQYVTVASDGLLNANSDLEGATLFTVASVGADGSITLTTPEGPVTVQGSQVVVASDSQPTPIFLLASLSGGALLAIGNSSYMYEATEGWISVSPEQSLAAAMEFQLRVTPVTLEELAQRYGIDLSVELSDCDLAYANFLWQVTGGLFFALGLGPFMANGKVATGILGLLRANAQVWSKITTAVTTITQSSSNVAAIAGAVAGVLAAVYAAGLFWKLLKFCLQQLGWWALFRVIAKVIETIVIPEAEIVELLASFAVWTVQTVTVATAVGPACN